MFKNYILIALRNLMRNKTYSLINIGGLALGMAVFVFANVLAQYERNHDIFFEKSDRIYTLGSVFSPTANIGVKGTDGIYTTMAPLLKADLPDIEAIARTVQREYLLTMGDRNFYQGIKFVDKSLLKIFDFDYLAGNNTALDDPSGIILTESLAKKFFPGQNAIGQVLSLDHKNDLRVTAVIRDIPKNSHFISSLIINEPLEAIAPLKALNKIADYDLAGNWNNLSMGNSTYVLLPAHLDRQWLEQQANDVFERHASESIKKFTTHLVSRKIEGMNLVLWEVTGMPVLESMVVLGFLVLIIAGLNYTNLATAQALGRAKEVGLRKTMGANMGQLLTQFLVESVATAFLAMLVALAILEILIPIFNDSLGKILTLDYLTLLPSLFGLTLLVGLIAGSYPAYIITRVRPVDALKESLSRGSKGSMVRSIMIGAQFVFSVFMMAMVAVVFFQNEKVKESSEIFPKSQIVTLERLGVEDLLARNETLKQEISAISGIEWVTFSSQVPFDQSNSAFAASKNSGDFAGKIIINQIIVEYDFLKTYNIPLLSGRDFSRDIANDLQKEDSEVLNVIVNELALKKLGLPTYKDAINKVFHEVAENPKEGRILKSFVIVGVMADQNFLGLHNSVKPLIFQVNPKYYQTASIRIMGLNFTQTMAKIEAVWKKVNPDYPIQVQFLDALFEDVFKIYKSMNIALAGFAVMALTLAFIGLFGLAAFMAAGRTKEIGIRKVMGAETYQIVTLLIWQFSRPVLWALVVALPMSYFASDAYLNFFAERIKLPIILIAGSGLIAVMLSWVIVSAHAYRVSSRKPIHALRYE